MEVSGDTTRIGNLQRSTTNSVLEFRGPGRKWAWRSVLAAAFLAMFIAFPPLSVQAQNDLPFEISNVKNKKWPELEASRIYLSACSLLARSLRPEKPPVLHPKFRLVLGSDDDAFVRRGRTVEIHLKSWNAEKFAQGVVVVAVREVLQDEDLRRLAHESVAMADATVDVRDLR
jgi:hypothetical protein